MHPPMHSPKQRRAPRPARPPSSAAPAILVAAALAAAGCAAGAEPAAPAAPGPIPVRVATALPGPVDRPILAGGAVAAKDAWTLSFKTGGLVARVHVRDGELVRRGQILAELDATEASAGVRQARAALAKAERDRARARALRAEGVIPPALAEDADTGAALAAASAAAAEFNLARAVIVARDAGWVDARLVEPGEVVAPGQPVLRTSGRGQGFVVRAALADRDALGLAPGRAASVVLDARPGEPIPGTVSEVARSPAAGTGTYDVEIRLDPARTPPDLLSGLTAKVEIARSVPAAAVVPLAALVEGDGEAGAVFAVEGGRARRLPVRIAFLRRDGAVLAAGLGGGAQVVTEGAGRLSDGAAVRLVP